MTSASLQGKTVAFLVANEGIEQVELTEPWKAVQQSALRRRWKLENGPVAGASDATKEAADDLRAQWQIRSAP